MARLRGMGLGEGMALGTAAVVRMRNGFPLMPPIPPRIAEMLSKHKLDETPDVILVAEDYQIALDIARALRWGKVVGIAAGSAAADALISDYPAVVNVPALLDIVQDDILMVVDADHGVVIADPDGMAIAQYQAERNRLAPKLRLFLDDAHLPAETVDGHAVLVLARVETTEDVEQALENGADALYVPFDAPLLPADTDDITRRQKLLALIDLSSGKSLLLADDYAVPPMLLLEACLRADITVAEPPVDHLDGMGLGEFAAELNEAQAECLASDTQCELPKLAVQLTSRYMLPQSDPEQIASFVDRLAVRGATRIVCTNEEDGLGPALMDNLVAAANASMVPVLLAPELSFYDVDASNSLQTLLSLPVGAGVAGLIIGAGSISVVKAAIRELNYSECREALSEMLTREGA